MKRLCVIGAPVGHSLSPAIHRRLIADAGVDYTYGICPVKAEELSDFVARARGGEYAGFNVTMPHKKTILPLLDELTEEARQCGAVNTVRVENGRAIGHNTDGRGFINSLREADVDPAGKTVLLIGAGGAAEALTWALVDAGAKLTLCNRDLARAQRLAARYRETATAIPFTADALRDGAKHAELIVNATPLGMAGQAQFPNFDFLDDTHGVVYDLVYHPEETELLRQAKRKGLQTIGGKALLWHQAVLAFAFFTE